ncbi:testis-expressed protein 15 isoform X2 [Hemicordylus capensis]|uniref:testis-expressed protein 15 isoform X2 n=1 Tax=Hemicordylus capensis TaxID=884348 RepID=UPI0023029182|nr:testis-expressed protein 15 isoform X2 [Hemicordylus capensis]
MVAVSRYRPQLPGRRRESTKQGVGPPPRAGTRKSPGQKQEEHPRKRRGGAGYAEEDDGLIGQEDGSGRRWIVEDKKEMEPKVRAIWKSITSNTKGSFLPKQNCLKNFTIPKRAPDKDFLMKCSTNQRDYNEIRQRLSQSCLDTECDLESLWHFDKIEMVHNKDLEEEFITKRTKMREEVKQDKEVSSFLVVSKDEVSKICQHGLHINHSTKKELNIVKELGNPQLGVYLFRYVDVALNYASKHSVQIENIIIFRVLLGRVKKIQPPKGKKKVALDPSPNFDCHISRIHPSLKDSVEDQAIGSLIYFYEYNELSKPVDRPRQCLPYAVVKVKCVNQKVAVETPVTSRNSTLKRLSKHQGKGRGLPLENCSQVTRVTRIGKNQLIYEHFKNEGCAVNPENNACAEVSSFSLNIQNWNGSSAETQCRKIKHKLNRRWDSAQIEINNPNLQCTPGVDVSRDVRSDHTGNSNQNPLKVHPGVFSDCNSRSSTVITSRLIKDPRLTKREQNLEKENGEETFHGILQYENELEYNSKIKIPTTLGIPCPLPKDFFLLNSKHACSQRQYMEKTSWQEITLGKRITPSLSVTSHSDANYLVNGKEGLGNVNKVNEEILASQSTHTLKTNLSHSSLQSKNNENGVLPADFKKDKGMKHSKLPLLLLNPSNTVDNEWKSQESQPVSITMHNKKQELGIEPPLCNVSIINISIQNPENVASGKDEMDNRRKSQLQEDSYTSQLQCSTDNDTRCARNKCTSSGKEHNGNGEIDSVQDHTLEFNRQSYLSGKMVKEVWTEENCEWSPDDQMDAENFEQNKLQAIMQSEKSCATEIPRKSNKQVRSLPEEANNSIHKCEEYTVKKEKDSSVKEKISDINSIIYPSHSAYRIGTLMRDFSEKCVCVSEPEPLDKNIFGEHKMSSSLGGQSTNKMDNVIVAHGSDQACTHQFEEGSYSKEKSKCISEIQITSVTENADKATGKEQEHSFNNDLRKNVDGIKDWMDISENADNLNSNSSVSDFKMNFQRKDSLTETELMKIESGKEKLKALHDQASTNKCIGLIVHQKTNHTAFMSDNSVPVPLGNVKRIEIKKPQPENTGSSNFRLLSNNLYFKDGVPETSEQDLEVICEDINIQDLESTSEIEITSELCKQWFSLPQKVHEHMSSEEAKFWYLKERMDWESLFGKSNLNTQVSGSFSVKENENESLKSGVKELETELNTSVCPDLQITIANILQPKLNRIHNSFRMKTKMGKCTAKYSGQKKSIIWSQEEKMGKCTQNQKHFKFYHKKKELNRHCSSKMVSSLSKGRFKTFAQSEKHIKNVLNSLNTEALLCKNKHLSQKIDGVMFHLRKAQRSVQKSLKMLAKAGKKRRVSLPKSYILESCDSIDYNLVSAKENSFSEKERSNVRESKIATEEKEANEKLKCKSERFFKSKEYVKHTPTLSLIDTKSHYGSFPLDSSVTFGSISDIAYTNDNVRNTRITELETVSEKTLTLDTTELKDLKPTSHEHIMSNEQKIYITVPSENTQENVTIITKQDSETSKCASKNIAKRLNSVSEGMELVVCQADKREDEGPYKSDVEMSIVELAKPVQTALESSAEKNISKPDDISKLFSTFKRMGNVFSNEKEALEISPALQENINMSVSVGRCDASSDAFLPPAEGKYDASVSVQLIPQVYGPESLSLETKSKNSSKINLEENCCDNLPDYFSEQKQKADFNGENTMLRTEQCCSNKFSQIAEREWYTSESRKSKSLTKSVKEPESYSERFSSSDYLLSPLSVDNNLLPLSNNYISQEAKKKKEKTEILESKEDFSNKKPYVIRDIPVKLFEKLASEQKDTNHLASIKESPCRQISSSSRNKGARFQSPLRTVNEQSIGDIAATDTLSHASYDVLPNVITPRSRLNERCISVGHPTSCKDLCTDIRFTNVGIELKSLEFIVKISAILKKADQSSTLNILNEQAIVCKKILFSFIRAFEKKQDCSFEHVLVSKEILANAEKYIWTSRKVKLCAIESLIELQIIMETLEFIENKKRLVEGEPTFRSLLWYDDSLCSELFGGPSGHQQQSNVYPTFHGRLNYSPLSELKNNHEKLIEILKNTRWENHSYYTFLKLRREIKECEAAMKSNSCFSDFFLSVPYVCGANFGDTQEDLENARKRTIDLIIMSNSLPDRSTEKIDHLWIIMDIITTKIKFIKTCEEVNIKASLFGLEHIFFDAAKILTRREQDKFINEDLNGGKGQNPRINETALSKLYGTYEHIMEKFRNEHFNSTPEEHVTRKSPDEYFNCEKIDKQREANYYIQNSLVFHLDVGYISKILDEAQSANLNKLQQLMCKCTEHLEIMKKYFQILQEENVSNILITKENVLDFMKSGGINVVILKPEAVEVYIEMAMMYEAVYFLKNSIARKVDKPRFRSLLWFDVSLLSELFQCQKKMAPFSYREGSLWKTIRSSVSELEEELSVIGDFAENVNYSYACRLLTREVSELSETRNLLRTSKSSISMCVDLVPYTIALNYGSTVSELEWNYSQLSLLLKKLMLADRKDLGKMAHTMKIMKTIEHMKFICTKQGKSPLPLVIYQMLKNWRKSGLLKREAMKTYMDTDEQQSTKHMYVSGFPVSNSTTEVDSQTQRKRPASVISEDCPYLYEEENYSHRKKKKKQCKI